MGNRHLPFWPKNAPPHCTLPETSLVFNLETSAKRYPDKAALIFYDTRISYRECWETVEQLAGYLQHACGVKRGDRVALYMQNSPQFMLAYYAILRADAMVVPVNAMLMEDEVRHLVTDSGARTAFAAQELLPRVAALCADGTLAYTVVATYSGYLREKTDLAVPEFVTAPVNLAAIASANQAAARSANRPAIGSQSHSSADSPLVAWRDAVAAGHAPAPHLAGPDDRCVLPYTSGTTGLPKGCIHTHRTVMSTLIAQTVWYGGVVADSTIFCTLPLFHVTAMQASMNTPLYTGATIVILPRWDRDVAGTMISRYRITHWTNITTMLVDFLANPRLAEYDISSLKRIGGGGAAMPEAVAQKLKDLTGMDYIEGYASPKPSRPRTSTRRIDRRSNASASRSLMSMRAYVILKP